MKHFIFRNYTVEPFFKGLNACFSGYEDISFIDSKADMYIWFYLSPYSANDTTIAEKITDYGNLLELVLKNIDNNKPVIVFTVHPIFKIDYQTTETVIEESVWNYNLKIRNLSELNRNIKMIDISGFLNRFSQEQLIDWKYYYLSQMPLNPKLAFDFNRWLKRQLEIVALNRKKCIVLDLDNTLWGGILGEDGREGIKMGEVYPGNTYHFFQEYLLQLYKAGIILAICSKNNEQDVLDVWEKHPDMLLRKEYFVTYRINWNNKADNIKEIAEELNIGLDSLVFVDDNPTERELVKQMLPQVTVPDFPQQPYLYPQFIKKLTDDYFSIYQFTQEDITKTQQYKENAERQQFKNQFVDFESYLRSLEIELTIEPLDDINIVRFAQMTQKTNQFNVTTYRHTETDIRNFANHNGWVYGLRVKDRFGDNGLTGLTIIKITDEKEAEINTFLLSCRILGKNIESVFIQYILSKLRKAGIQSVKATYIKTLKNEQVSMFYEQIGFHIENVSPDKKTYAINLDDFDYIIPDIYKLIENER